jgi:hypothetical protein
VAFFTFDFTDSRSLVRGDDFPVLFNWSQAATPKGTATPVDMTGWTGIVNLYSPGVDTPVATLPVTLDNLGNISFTVPHGVTATFNKGDFIYHVVLTDGSGLSRTRILGKIKVI